LNAQKEADDSHSGGNGILKIMLQLAVLAILATVAALGTPVTCPTQAATDITVFLAGGANVDGCILGDKLFENFTYTGTGSTTAATVQFSNVVAGEYKVTFLPASGAVWTSAINFGFDVTVQDPNYRIGVVNDQMYGGIAGTQAAVQFGINPDGGGFSYLTADNLVAGNQTVQLNGLSATKVANSAAYNGQDRLYSIEQTFAQLYIPEPASFAMLGGGLLILALLRVRKS
jgi:hypothetical protein